MKKTALFLGLSIIFLASCTKSKVTPPSGTVAQRTISVEYRITNASGSVTVDYIAPNTSGTLVTTYATINKTYESVSFSSKSNNVFTINAKNSNMSTQNITVDIYVDGQLFQSGSLDHGTLTASASGKVQ